MDTWATRTIQTSRLRHRYRIQGDADGLPLLLLHGSFASGLWWEPCLELLPEAVLAVAPDLRGCGGTDKPVAGYTIEAMADDIHAFVEALGWVDFDLVGHAAGGAVAIEYTLRHQELVNSLILVDSAPIEGIFTPLDTVTLLNRMQRDRTLLAEALSVLMPSYGKHATELAFFERIVDEAAQMAPAAFTEVAVALGQWNRAAEAKSLTLPALIVWGEYDTLVSRDEATRTLLAIPGANQMEVLAGVGHSPMLEAPFALVERIVDFITQDFDALAAIRDSAAPPPDTA